MEALSNLWGAMIGLAVVMLILALVMYIVQGIFLTKLNKLMYGKPLSLIQSNAQRQKHLVKTTDGEVEYNRNAA